MKKVLILTYYWPPAGGPGVQRFLKFCKYLRGFGWEPVVITPARGSYPYLDPTLEEDIPEGVNVIKTKTFEPYTLYNRLTGKKGKSVSVGMIGYRDSRSPVQYLARYIRANFFVPDARKGWMPYAYRAAKRFIRENGADAVITTGPPHSTHLAGLRLKKLGMPWVADFRDPWTTVYYNAYFPRSERTRTKDQRLENSVLAGADAVTVISPGLLEEFHGRSRQVELIFNGYDEADFQPPEKKPHEKFRITYTGNYKPNQDVPVLWEILAGVAKKDPEFAGKLELRFTGIVDPGILQSINSAGLGKYVVTEPFVPHQEAVARMQAADLLLFIVPQAENNHLILTGKIFEYMASGSRILALGPSGGDAARLLEQAGCDPMMDYFGREAIREFILRSFELWKANGGLVPAYEGEGYRQFSRKAMTGKLAGILDKLSR